MASYEQNKNNKLWSVRFREIDLKDGTEHNKRLSGFKTKREAQAAFHDHKKHYDEERALLASVHAENPQLEMTFDQLAELFFRSLEGSTRESSIITYRSKYTSGIEEFFRGKVITDIKQIDIVEWKQWLTDKGFSYGYKDDIRTVLGFIFKFGEDTFELKNVFKKVKGFRDVDFTDTKSCGDNFLPPSDVQKLLDSTKDEVYRRFFLALFHTGCRIGEMFALKWSDVDETRQVISITKSITRKCKGAPYKITPPKNKTSVRDIPVSQYVIDELRKQADLVGRDSAFLFGGAIPLPEKTTENKLKGAIAEANLKRITLHGLRHSCATLLLSRNVSIVAVGKRLGHKNIKETVDTYGHLLPSDSNLMVEILSNIT